MKRSSKSKRVSWAPRFNLFQVKLFSSEDCPSVVGHNNKLQANLQAKTMWMQQFSNSTTDSSDVPPGFEGKKFQNKLKEEVPKIPQIRWKCPPKFIPRSDWFVAVSGESEEKDAQKLREMKVIEAVYPRHDSIPSSPRVSMDVENAQYDDSVTPIIPMIPIEGEDSMDGKVTYPVSMQPEFLPPQMSATATTPICAKTGIPPSFGVCNVKSGISPNQMSDRVASVSAALAAIVKFSKEGSIIDSDMLMKILTDPKMSERLIKEHARIRTAKNTSTSIFSQPTNIINPPNPSVTLSRATGELNKDVTRDMVGLPSTIPTSRTATPAIQISKPTVDMNRAVNQDAVGVTNFVANMLMNQNTIRLSKLSSEPASLAVRSALGRPDSRGPMNQDMHHNPDMVNVKTVPSSSCSGVPGKKRVASTAFPDACPEPNSVVMSAGNMHSVAIQFQPVMSSMPNLSKTTSISSALKDSRSQKDMNYYKNLIKEHGMEKHEIRKRQIGKCQSDIRDVKLVNRPKYQKSCIYFTSSKGCRNGSNCQYTHDMNVHLKTTTATGVHVGKRLRL